MKLNTDGAVSHNSPHVEVGGVFRDADTNWLWGFSMLLGIEEVFKVEARAILEGLHIAWAKGVRKLEVDSDNALLMETITKGEVIDSHLRELRSIHDMVNRDWKVFFRHIPRKRNAVADHMAKSIATRFTEV